MKHLIRLGYSYLKKEKKNENVLKKTTKVARQQKNKLSGKNIKKEDII